MPKKWLSLILAVAMAVGLVFLACNEKSTETDDKLPVWTTYNTSNSGLAHDDVLAIAIDASANKWFGTYDGGVSKFDGTNWTTYNTSNSGLASNEVLAIAIDASGSKWFGTQGGGISKFPE
jgi:ligand-binding sensor domain-containing protein